eukprot:453444-Amorphochlora_amoeboformis.AAC.1
MEVGRTRKKMGRQRKRTSKKNRTWRKGKEAKEAVKKSRNEDSNIHQREFRSPTSNGCIFQNNGAQMRHERVHQSDSKSEDGDELEAAKRFLEIRRATEKITRCV